MGKESSSQAMSALVAAAVTLNPGALWQAGDGAAGHFAHRSFTSTVKTTIRSCDLTRQQKGTHMPVSHTYFFLILLKIFGKKIFI